MKILVTGGAGFIGSHIVDGFLAQGAQAVVVDNLSTGKDANLNPQATFHRLDICDPELGDVFERERPDLVSHHAAQIDVRKAVADPAFDARVNLLGTLNVLECAARVKVKKVLFASTGGAIYGEAQYLPADEQHPIQPESPYGIHKHTAEQYLRVFQQTQGLDYAALRYANVYGPRQDPLGEAGVVAIFIHALLAGREATIFGDGEQTRDFVYVGDVVRANLLAADRSTPEPMNIGTGVGTSVNQIYGHLTKLLGIDCPPRYAEARAGEVQHIYLAWERARATLGWQPQMPLEKGLGHTVEFFRSLV